MNLLTLDRSIPMLWRSPTSIQWGTDPVLCRLDGVGAPEERMLHALEAGVSPTGVPVLAPTFGLGRARLPRMMQAIAPILTSVQPTPPPRTIVVHSASRRSGMADRTAVSHNSSYEAAPQPGSDRPGVALLCAALPDTASVVRHSRADSPPDFAVIVGGFVVHEDDVAPWMSADVAHLLVRFTESAGLVGPLVQPGITSCTSCAERWLTDEDPQRLTLVGQLRQLDPPRLAGAVLLQTVSLAARIVTEWLAESGAPARQSSSAPPPAAAPPSASALPSRVLPSEAPHIQGLLASVADGVLRIDAATAEVSRLPAPHHPECGCRAL